MVLALFVAAAITDNQTIAQTLYRKAQAAVVTISTPSMTGSGFFVGDGSLVMTCYHVIRDDPEAVTVKGFGKATLVRTDERCDVAIFRVSKKSSIFLSLSKGQAPSPGAQVYVIGSPLGVLEKSITEGTLSSIRRVDDRAFLQITAPISHGSSGSPVLDKSGSVIGMAAASLEKGQGLNFAVSAFNLRQSLNAANGKPIPIATANWKPEATVATLFPTTLLERMDVTSSAVYSARKGEIFEVARTKFPEWYSIRFLNGDIGYIRKKDFRHATPEEIEAGNKEVTPSPEIAELVKQFSDSEQAAAAVKKLVTIGEKALEYVAYKARFYEEDVDISEWLTATLAEFGRKAGPTLVTMLQDGNRLERDVAIGALFDMTLDLDAAPDEVSKERIEELDSFLHEQVIVKEILNALEDPFLQDTAEYIVDNLDLVEAHDVIVKRINADNEKIHNSTLSAFAKVVKPEDEGLLRRKSTERINEGLDEGDKKDPASNYAVSMVFDSLVSARKNPTATRVFVEYLDNDDRLVRYFACNSILGTNRTDLLAHVESLLDDVEPLVRFTALRAATELNKGGYTVRIVNAARSSEPFQRWIATQCAIHNHDRDVIRAVLPLVSDKETDVRSSLIEALVSIGGETAKNYLGQLSKDPDPSVRKEAKSALEKLGKS